MAASNVDFAQSFDATSSLKGGAFMTPVNDNDTNITILPDLAEQIQAAAVADCREPGALVCEALERYMEERRWNKTLAFGDIRSKALALTIPRALAAEVQAAADEEHRERGDLVREALERYIQEWKRNKTSSYHAAHLKMLGITEEDVLCPRA
jgi:predicted transcriptional regulator